MFFLLLNPRLPRPEERGSAAISGCNDQSSLQEVQSEFFGSPWGSFLRYRQLAHSADKGSAAPSASPAAATANDSGLDSSASFREGRSSRSAGLCAVVVARSNTAAHRTVAGRKAAALTSASNVFDFDEDGHEEDTKKKRKAPAAAAAAAPSAFDFDVRRGAVLSLVFLFTHTHPLQEPEDKAPKASKCVI